MKKILILKNDRVGDLFNSLDGINSIISDHSDYEVEIVLSNISKDLNFLFNLKNVRVSFLPYRLSMLNKFSFFQKILINSYDKIFILSPKNIYFYAPLFCKSKFYAITIKNSNKSRPTKFLKNKLYKYLENNRDEKKINESINSLIFKLCSNNSFSSYKNILNNNPKGSVLFNKNLNLFKNFIHVHYKNYIFINNGWDINKFFSLLNELSKEHNIILTSDFGRFDYHKHFLSNFSYLDFSNSISEINLKNKIHYLHNIGTSDLFKLVSMSNSVISPHGAMTVMASYLDKKVIDIFDQNITINAFREYKPKNKKYNFLIIKSDYNKILFKINKFL